MDGKLMALALAAMILFTGCGSNGRDQTARPQSMLKQLSLADAALIDQAQIGFDVAHVRRASIVAAAPLSQNLSSYDNAVQQIYIAYFGRPADPGGELWVEGLLGQWGIATDLQGVIAAYNSDAKVKALLDGFGTSAESQALYPGTTSDFVTAIYLNLFNRKADPAGLAYWVAAIDRGGLTRAGAALTIMSGAQSTDISTIASKTTTAGTFTALVRSPIQYDGLAAGVVARDMLAKVDYTTDQTAFLSSINSAWRASAAIHAIPVQKSSYENKAGAGEAIGAQKLPNEVAMGNAVAFADFFQDGTYSMVTHSLEYDSQIPATAKQFGHIHFWRNVNGIWVDNTAKLLTANTGCLHPRKAIVADFNGDGIPDVFFACHGFDAPPFPGESPHVLLSQADGTFKNVTLPVTCFCHSASAADVNGDGFPDVLVVDNMIQQTPFFLINNKDGTFSKDITRLPSDTKYKPIFTAELIDFANTGKYDAFLGGHEQDPSASWPSTILPNDGTGNFVSTARVTLPSLQGYGFPTDIMYKSGAIYLARTIDLSTNFYRGAAIQKVAYPSLASQSIYQHTTPYPSGSLWINWIVTNGGNIVTLDSTYGISLPQ
jgi:hypothetical protein